MPPNTVDANFGTDLENVPDSNKETNVPLTSAHNMSRGKFMLKVFTSTLNLFAYLLIGITVGIAVTYAIQIPITGTSMGSTPKHIILCVLGYQLLMSVAILSQSPDSNWSAILTLTDKRRVHTILQVIGSGLAIAGSFIKILDKSSHWTSLHGKFGLVALVFTTVSLVNGLASLYAFEWRRCLPGNLSKLTHICFGIVAFAASSICLCYGFDKSSFRTWAGNEFTIALITITGTFTSIVILNPFITFITKSKNLLRK